MKRQRRHPLARPAAAGHDPHILDRTAAENPADMQFALHAGRTSAAVSP